MIRSVVGLGALLVAFAAVFDGDAAVFRVASYNLENYLDVPTDTRPAKSPESRARIRESIASVNPDVIALQEVGSTNALAELQRELKREGLDFPNSEFIEGSDTNVHVAVLSKFSFLARHPHPGDSYLLGGRRFKVSRGFAELEIQVSEAFKFTLLAAHLKSKRLVPEADEAEMRLEEAKLLRQRVDSILAASPEARIVVAGDFNDTKDSRAVRTVVGRGRGKLTDTRPAEQNGDNTPGSNPAWSPRNIAWTHFYGKEDSYARIDYILLSPAMAGEWISEKTYVLALPNWGLASDHRPIVATFDTGN